MLEKHYISEGFFTDEEIKEFKEKFGYDIRYNTLEKLDHYLS